VGHKNFDLWYDPGNIFFYSNGELDPVDDAATVDGLVRTGMCIKDFDMVDKDGKPTRDVWLTPGTGRVDFPKVLAKLRAAASPAATWSSSASRARTPTTRRPH
jgi:sugar phosphate isomerase/epimerase